MTEVTESNSWHYLQAGRVEAQANMYIHIHQYTYRFVYICLSVLQCPDSTCKQDLLAYLQRIALYCHQLNICSKVKAEVQNLGGELVVSGVS